VSSATLAQWKEAHDQVVRGIQSIPPQYIKPDYQASYTENLSVSKISQYGKIKVKGLLAGGSLEIARLFENKLKEYQEIIELGEDDVDQPAMRHGEEKLIVEMAFQPSSVELADGAETKVGLGLIGVTVNHDNRKVCTVAHAIYAEDWKEQPGVYLNKDADIWSRPVIRQYLLHKMLESGLPDVCKQHLKV